MLAKIFIQNLTMQAKVGHQVHERHTPQEVVVNIAVWADVGAAIETGDLADTVDYCEIQKAVIELGAAREFVLIESLASEILEICLAHEHAVRAWVRVEKPHKLAESESVGIELEGSKDSPKP